MVDIVYSLQHIQEKQIQQLAEFMAAQQYKYSRAR